jgi:glutamine amidotransferase
MTIGVIDYGAGNMRSVTNALDALALVGRVVASAGDLDRCSRVILPGVGHFAPAARRLADTGLDDALRAAVERGVPLLGVCLGAQLLLAGSAEAPDVPGLGIINGSCDRLTTTTVPHMGWNAVTPRSGAGLFDVNGDPAYFYFAHSFVCKPEDPAVVAADTECDGQRFCVALERGRVFGVQFHPEKSAQAGLDLLQRFATC